MLFRAAAASVMVCVAFAYAQDSSKKPDLTPLEHELLQMTNKEREKEKLPALKLDATLSRVAHAHSANMARQGKMQHDLDDKSPFDRIRGAGYKYQFAGENIAAGDVPLDLVMSTWMKSEGHRKNILDKNYTHIGVGAARDDKGAVYYTQVFAKPRP